MGAQPRPLGERDNMVERGAEPLQIARLSAGRALGAAAYDEMQGAKFSREPRGLFDPGKFFAKNIVEDEIGAGIDRD